MEKEEIKEKITAKEIANKEETTEKIEAKKEDCQEEGKEKSKQDKQNKEEELEKVVGILEIADGGFGFLLFPCVFSLSL